MKYLIFLVLVGLLSCTNTEEISDKNVGATATTLQAPASFNAAFTTSKGKFTLSCYRDWGKEGVDRLYNLIKQDFYNEVRFFRNVPGFVVQFGISGNPKVSSIWKNANIKDDPVKKSNSKGTLSFATAGKNTRTTQLFINLGDNSRLDSMGFTPLCEITGGMETVLSLYSGYGESPTSKQGYIESQGNKYLNQNFPKLDYIKKVKIL